MINLKYRNVTADWLIGELNKTIQRMKKIKSPKKGEWIEQRIYRTDRNDYKIVYIKETKKEYTKRVKALDTHSEYVEYSD